MKEKAMSRKQIEVVRMADAASLHPKSVLDET